VAPTAARGSKVVAAKQRPQKTDVGPEETNGTAG